MSLTQASAAKQVAQYLGELLGARYQILLKAHLVRACFVQKGGDVVKEKLKCLIS